MPILFRFFPRVLVDICLHESTSLRRVCRDSAAVFYSRVSPSFLDSIICLHLPRKSAQCGPDDPQKPDRFRGCSSARRLFSGFDLFAIRLFVSFYRIIYLFCPQSRNVSFPGHLSFLTLFYAIVVAGGIGRLFLSLSCVACSDDSGLHLLCVGVCCDCVLVLEQYALSLFFGGSVSRSRRSCFLDVRNKRAGL